MIITKRQKLIDTAPYIFVGVYILLDSLVYQFHTLTNVCHFQNCFPQTELDDPPLGFLSDI